MRARLRIDLSTLGELPFFSRQQAREWGVSDKDLQILVHRRRIVRLDRGFYSDRVAASAEELHVLRTLAALALHGESVAADRCSAALLHGLPLVRSELGTVELVRTDRSHGRRRAGVRENVAPLPTVEVAVADLGITARAVDIPHAILRTAMSNHPAAALAAGDHALRQRLCTHDDLTHAARSMAGRAGVEAARAILPHLEPRHESPGETLTAWTLRQLGWSIEPQHKVCAEGRSYRIDFVLSGRKVAIEFDGQVKYSVDEIGVREAQDLRQDALEREGWIFVRLDWTTLADPDEVNRRVLEAVRTAPTR